MDRTLRIAVGPLPALLVASTLAAQEQVARPLPTVLEGLTVDAQSGLPFPNVQLRFDTGERVTSDEAGRYVVEDVPVGRHRVAIVTGRCNVSFGEVTLAPGEIKRVAFAVPTEMVGQGPTLAQLKKRSEGAYYSSEELLEMNPRNLLDALRRLAPDMVGPEGGQPGTGASLQGRIRTAQGVNPPVVVFDGVQVADGMRALRDFRPQDVASMEILKGASRGWEYGTGGAGGVIKVLTRRVMSATASLTPTAATSEIGPAAAPCGEARWGYIAGGVPQVFGHPWAHASA